MKDWGKSVSELVIGKKKSRNCTQCWIQSGPTTCHCLFAAPGEKHRVGWCCTRSDNKVMRLVPKKSFILFIYQLQCGRLQSTFLVPAHTLSSGVAIVCSILGTYFVGCRLKVRVTHLWMSSVDSKRYPFTVDFTF